MPVPLLDLRAQHATIRDEVVAAMMKVVDSQLFILGAAVEELEAAVAKLSHTKYAVGCANGTDALLLALRALDCGPGDEVITTPFTFFATAGTIHNVGAKPVFVDIDPKTFNILPDAAAAARTSRSKACVPGRPVRPNGSHRGRDAGACQGFRSSRTPLRPLAPAGRSTANGAWRARWPRSGPSASSRRRIWVVTETVG